MTDDPHAVGSSVGTRPLRLSDADELAELVIRNRDFLRQWLPSRADDYFTASGQVAAIERVLADYERGGALPHVIVANDGRIVGRVTLVGIVRGPQQSCSVGYWVDRDNNGRGFATAAVGRLKEIAFTELGLHRIQAEALVRSTASQRVLARQGFQPIGVAHEYVNIAGRWEDVRVFQIINHDWLMT